MAVLRDTQVLGDINITGCSVINGCTFVTTNGKVGIANVSPQEAIHVNGNLRLDDSSGNAGFKLSFDNSSKTLNFIYVGI